MSINSHDTRETMDQQKFYDIKSAFTILNYNQSLVQLADSKAGNLIVINSIFLASLSSLVMGRDTSQKVLGGLEGLFIILFFAATVSALFYCLAIIMTKGIASEGSRHLDLIFFGDIAKKRTAENYIFDFISIKPKEFLADILGRTHTTALIADKKFDYTRTAQTITLISCILWLVILISLFVR